MYACNGEEPDGVLVGRGEHHRGADRGRAPVLVAARDARGGHGTEDWVNRIGEVEEPDVVLKAR